jgi:hypothetical protein
MLSDLDLIFAIGSIGSFALLSYALYWALAVRHALFIRLYRNQALGVGLVALAVLLSVYGPFPSALFPYPSSTDNLFGFIIIFFAILLIFFWIDSSIRAARRSDPLLRDILHWSKVRKVLWPLDIGIVAILAVWIVLNLGNLLLFLVPYLIDIAAGALFIPIAAKRSKDPVLRKHFIWFGVFFLSLVPLFFGEVNFPNDVVSDLLVFGGLFLGGYALYRSARSLVPLNQISLDASGK